jgi:DNA-binding Lrp family transcriptional regulator
LRSYQAAENPSLTHLITQFHAAELSLAHTKSAQTINDGLSDLEARIIAAIESAGPRNIAQISRMTGTHQETIRYKIKKRFARLGFEFHAEVDFSKLGLGLHWGTLSLAKAYKERAPQILRALSQVGYLTYFAKVVPQGNYVGLFALPRNAAAKYKELLAGLSSEGVLNDFALEEVLATRHKAMDPKFFNFRSGRWEVDWNKVADQTPTPLPISRTPRAEKFDLYDLLIIKELQKDSLQHLTEIAKKLKAHQKTLEYHYRTHVQRWKLIPLYGVSWAQDTSNRPTHSTATTLLTFHDLGKQELAEAQAAVSKIPFLWAEDQLQGGTYIATLHTPITELINVSSYINESIRGLDSGVDIGFIKSTDTTSLTIPYHMYQNGSWKFDVHGIRNALKLESAALLRK